MTDEAQKHAENLRRWAQTCATTESRRMQEERAAADYIERQRIAILAAREHCEMGNIHLAAYVLREIDGPEVE